MVSVPNPIRGPLLGKSAIITFIQCWALRTYPRGPRANVLGMRGCVETSPNERLARSQVAVLANSSVMCYAGDQATCSALKPY